MKNACAIAIEMPWNRKHFANKAELLFITFYGFCMNINAENTVRTIPKLKFSAQ